MTHDEIFGLYDPIKAKNKASEQYIVFEWVGDQLYKKTFNRNYFCESRGDGGKIYTDSYTSQAVARVS